MKAEGGGSQRIVVRTTAGRTTSQSSEPQDEARLSADLWSAGAEERPILFRAPAQKGRSSEGCETDKVSFARVHGAAGHYAQPCDPVGWAGLNHRHRPCLLPQARGGWPSSMEIARKLIIIKRSRGDKEEKI